MMSVDPPGSAVVAEDLISDEDDPSDDWQERRALDDWQSLFPPAAMRDETEHAIPRRAVPPRQYVIPPSAIPQSVPEQSSSLSDIFVADIEKRRSMNKLNSLTKNNIRKLYKNILETRFEIPWGLQIPELHL